MFVKIKNDPNWYRVINVTNTIGNQPTIYILNGKGRVDYEDIEKIEFD